MERQTDRRKDEWRRNIQRRVLINGQMDFQIYGKTDRKTYQQRRDRRLDGYNDRQTNRERSVQRNKQMEIRMDGRKDEWRRNRQSKLQMNCHTDKQMLGKTDRHIDR